MPPFILYPLLPLSWVESFYFEQFGCLSSRRLLIFLCVLFILPLLSFPLIPTHLVLPPPSLHQQYATVIWASMPVQTDLPLSFAAWPGEELADEHLLRSGMPCELPAFWLVSLVRMFSNMWPHRFVCTFISIRLKAKEREIKYTFCCKSYQTIFRNIESGCLSFQDIWAFLVPQISPRRNVCDALTQWDICSYNQCILVKLHHFVSPKGKMIRRRTVTQPSQGDGRPCPALTHQSKPCPVKPCYQWQYGPWSPCHVQVPDLRRSYGNGYYLFAFYILYQQYFSELTNGMFPLKGF